MNGYTLIATSCLMSALLFFMIRVLIDLGLRPDYGDHSRSVVMMYAMLILGAVLAYKALRLKPRKDG